MRALGFVIVLAGASCAHPSSVAPVETESGPADQTFRPSPLPVLGPATPAGAQCLPRANDPEAYERGRLIAALDLELRRQGGMLLVEGEGNGKHTAVGTVTTVGNKITMVVGSRTCGEYSVPSFGLDDHGAVFEVAPRYHAAEHRKVAVCELSCHFGCGANMPPTSITVVVPAHAHWVGVRMIDVPIDVEVEETYPPAAQCGPGPP